MDTRVSAERQKSALEARHEIVCLEQDNTGTVNIPLHVLPLFSAPKREHVLPSQETQKSVKTTFDTAPEIPGR